MTFKIISIILRNLDNFLPGAFYSIPLQLGTKECAKKGCSLFNKIPSLQPATVLKRILAQLFSFKFCELFENNSFREHLRVATAEIRRFIRLS